MGRCPRSGVDRSADRVVAPCPAVPRGRRGFRHRPRRLQRRVSRPPGRGVGHMPRPGPQAPSTGAPRRSYEARLHSTRVGATTHRPFRRPCVALSGSAPRRWFSAWPRTPWPCPAAPPRPASTRSRAAGSPRTAAPANSAGWRRQPRMRSANRGARSQGLSTASSPGSPHHLVRVFLVGGRISSPPSRPSWRWSLPGGEARPCAALAPWPPRALCLRVGHRAMRLRSVR